MRREKSAKRKMYEEAKLYFKNKYTNDVTSKNYVMCYKRFLNYCHEFHNAKTKDECQAHIQIMSIT